MDSTAGEGGRSSKLFQKNLLHSLFIRDIHMYGSGENQANTLGRGAPEEACGEDIRPEVILAAFDEAGTHRVSGSHRLAGIPFLQGVGGRQLD